MVQVWHQDKSHKVMSSEFLFSKLSRLKKSVYMWVRVLVIYKYYIIIIKKLHFHEGKFCSTVR